MMTIITVCKNAEKTIARTIDSVLGQTVSKLRYIIRDGKSTDGTMDIIRAYESRFNGRLRWISEPDRGMYDAMNKGIAMVDEGRIGILNSDDWYEPDTVETVAVVGAHLPETIVHGLLRIFKDGKEFMVRGSSHEFLNVTMIEHPTCFVPVEVYRRFGVYDARFRYGADYELMLRFKARGVSFHWEQKVMTNFSSGGLSDAEYTQSLLDRARILRMYGIYSPAQYYRELIKTNLKLAAERFGV
jgi:glycosyltransferase involved in cell wall biosynthesis